jgi:hydroxyacylglutathione hydrolase
LNASLQIHRVISMPFSENTYLVHRSDAADCLVIDPGFEPDSILRKIAEKNLIPRVILNTHGHSDHIAGNEALKAQFPDCPLVIGAAEAAKLTDPMLNLSAPFGLELISPPADRTVVEGEVLEYAGISLEVRDTPGHSSGHVVFVTRDVTPWVVFGGDVLFRGSIGRTDFPDGDTDQLLRSIREKLLTLPDTTRVLPGHGDATTIAEERRHNPFLQG